jgi:hypothetical protein
MDQETIQKIAAEVVARLPYGDRYWVFLLVNVVIMAIIGALVVLGTSRIHCWCPSRGAPLDRDRL